MATENSVQKKSPAASAVTRFEDFIGDKCIDILAGCGLIEDFRTTIKLARQSLPPENAGEKAIYSYYLDCGRMGDLDGIFTANKSDITKIIGETVYFGEVLGKHSDISDIVDEGDFTLISDNPADVEMFERLGLSNGYNPFNYWNVNHG